MEQKKKKQNKSLDQHRTKLLKINTMYKRGKNGNFEKKVVENRK